MELFFSKNSTISYIVNSSFGSSLYIIFEIARVGFYLRDVMSPLQTLKQNITMLSHFPSFFLFPKSIYILPNLHEDLFSSKLFAFVVVIDTVSNVVGARKTSINSPEKPNSMGFLAFFPPNITAEMESSLSAEI